MFGYEPNGKAIYIFELEGNILKVTDAINITHIQGTNLNHD